MIRGLGRFIAAFAVLAALSACFAIGIWVLDRASLDLPAHIGYAPLLLGLNAVPGLLLAAALYALTRKLLCSMLLAFALQAALLFANGVKLDLLAAPIMIHDFAILQHSKGML